MSNNETRELSLGEKFGRAGLYLAGGTVVTSLSTSVICLAATVASSLAPHDSLIYSLKDTFKTVGQSSWAVAMGTVATGALGLGGLIIYSAFKGFNAPGKITREDDDVPYPPVSAVGPLPWQEKLLKCNSNYPPVHVVGPLPWQERRPSGPN